MEDQRNWTDASYKTYSTPLDLPYSGYSGKGTIIKQSVTISINAAHRTSLTGKISGNKSPA